MPRPHVLGWGETPPQVYEGHRCKTCGKTGAHDIIVLGKAETDQIVESTKGLGPRIGR